MIVRVLIWLIVGFLVYTVYQACKQALNKPDKPPPEKTGRGEDMVHDPQCGTYVPKSDAVSALIDGQRHHFCSTECRDLYQTKDSS